jgi:hypothetical protein
LGKNQRLARAMRADFQKLLLFPHASGKPFALESIQVEISVYAKVA